MDDLISRAAAIARIDKCVALSGIGLEPVMAVRDIKALISVLPAVDAVPVVRCKDCPWTECETIGNGTIEIPRDLALAVMRELVANEPRVIKPEALRNGGIVVWYEVKGEEPRPCVVGEYDRDSRYFMGSTGCGETTISEWEDYNIKWRCWTSRPDEKRRAETLWE